VANHAHRQIREAAETQLAGLATTGSRVYANRHYAIPASSLPALRISLDDEQVDAATIHANATYDRQITMAIECCAQDGDTVDDTCDQMSKEVETALAPGLTIGGRVFPLLYRGSRYDDEAAALDAAVKRLEFRLDFSTLASAPDTIL
jgi:hypothetical protein